MITVGITVTWEMPDDSTLEEIEKEVRLIQMMMPPNAHGGWAIIDDAGAPIPPSQYPKKVPNA